MTFAAPTKLGDVLGFNQPAFDAPEQLEAADFNGDGKVDFLVTRARGEGNTPVSFAFMINQGNDTWVDKTDAMFGGNVPTVTYTARVIVADLNGDGRSDVYVPDFGIHNAGNTGGFDQVWLSTPTGMRVGSVATAPHLAHGSTSGDIDGDGDIDVIVNDVDVPSIRPRVDQTLINNGAGAFTDDQALLPPSLRTTDLAKLSHTSSLLVDVTGDGKLDLVLGTWEAATNLKPNFSPPSQVLINDGSGSFANSPIIQLPQSPVTPESVIDIKSTDLNGDGLNDLILAITRGGDGSTGQYYGTGYIQILINKGGGQFADETASRYAQEVANTPSSWWKYIRIVDFNGDGAKDLLLSGAGGGAYLYHQAARVLLNDGSGHFSDSLTLDVQSGLAGIQPDATTAADVNGDGYADIVALQFTSATTVSLVALLNQDAPVLNGGAAADSLRGTAGNDTLTGLGGNDSIDGGAGIDTAVYTGARSAYTVTRTSIGYTVSGGTDGTDTLVNVERLQFSDAKVAIDTAGNGGMAYRLYQAAFNRTPDKGGLGFQMNALDTGSTLSQVAANFIASPEFAKTYGALDNTQFVTQLYANVLHRAPDAGGLAFHTGNLATGATTRVTTLVGFSESPENQAALVGVIQDGMVYSS
jgi:hypothetical protein